MGRANECKISVHWAATLAGAFPRAEEMSIKASEHNHRSTSSFVCLVDQLMDFPIES